MTSESSNHKVPRLWRWIAIFAALAIGTCEIVGYKVARAINLNYFKDPAVPISSIDIAGVLVGLYLLCVAIFGYWLPRRKGS